MRENNKNNILGIMGCVVLSMCTPQVTHAATTLATWNFSTSWSQAQTVTLPASSFNNTLLSGTPQLVATQADPLGNVQQAGNTMRIHPSGSATGDGSTIILQLTLASRINNTFTVTFDENPSVGSANVSTWEYSLTSGASWTSITSFTVPTSGGVHTLSFDINLDVAGGTALWFRDTLSGAVTGANGHDVDFDNMIVAVPEPVNTALGVMAVGFVGLLGGRRVYCWVTA